MGVRAERHKFHGARVQGYIPKRVVEHRCAFERLG